MKLPKILAIRFNKIPIKSAGLTLIEILVVIGILAGIAALGLFLSVDVYTGGSFRAEQDILVSVFGKARSRALSNINESPHGVYIENAPAQYTIFQGASYDPLDITNEVIVVKGIVENDGPKEFVFTQLSGDVLSPGSVTITSGVKSNTIFISSDGQINW